MKYEVAAITLLLMVAYIIFKKFCYPICQFLYVSINVLVDDYQVVVKEITKHLLSINGRKDWKKKQQLLARHRTGDR